MFYCYQLPINFESYNNVTSVVIYQILKIHCLYFSVFNQHNLEKFVYLNIWKLIIRCPKSSPGNDRADSEKLGIPSDIRCPH